VRIVSKAILGYWQCQGKQGHRTHRHDGKDIERRVVAISAATFSGAADLYVDPLLRKC
jgi:hypothetical protein